MTDKDRKESEMTDRSHIYQEIQDERGRQDAKWGGFKHDITHTEHDWLVYIVKQLGEAADADPIDFRGQMVRVAALAVAAIECADADIGP